MRSSLLRAALALVVAATALGAAQLTPVHADGAHPSTVGPCTLSPGQICIDIVEPPIAETGTIVVTGLVQDSPGLVTFMSGMSPGVATEATNPIMTTAMVGSEYAAYSFFRLTLSTSYDVTNYTGYVYVWVVKGDPLFGPSEKRRVVSNVVRYWVGLPTVAPQVCDACQGIQK